MRNSIYFTVRILTECWARCPVGETVVSIDRTFPRLAYLIAAGLNYLPAIHPILREGGNECSSLSIFSSLKELQF